ncbi:MAG: tetratricopeptide repeat protein [Candidatus Cloacimonetes bacterium]|nr:tetratricopeptide repeat protein [Candidatus Cloacimonadota bacterium]
MYKKASVIMIILSICLIGSLTAQDKSLERIANETAQAGNDAFQAKDFSLAGQKYEEAVTKLNEATEKEGIPLDKAKAQQWLNIAYSSFVKAKQFGDAVRILEKRKAMDPGNYKLVKDQALIYKKYLKDTPKAIEVLKVYDDARPSFKAQKKIADYYVGMNDLQNALQWYEKAYDLKKDSNVIKQIAVIHNKLGQNGEAVKAYEDFLKTNPSQAVLIKTYKNMASLYSTMNNEAKAVEYFEKTIELKYDEAVAIVLMTKYFDQENFDASLAKANLILSKNATQQDAIYYKGLNLYKKGDNANAKIYLAKVTDSKYKSSASGFIKSIESR